MPCCEQTHTLILGLDPAARARAGTPTSPNGGFTTGEERQAGTKVPVTVASHPRSQRSLNFFTRTAVLEQRDP
uniref:Uncharacterized protein n=1 Tax=Oryza nivara TaxID=4536 RepID=A0A0E0HEK7_ORYNI